MDDGSARSADNDDGARTVFREAADRDLAAIVTMLADDALGATRERPGEPLDAAYLDAFAAIERDPNNELVVVETDGGLAGVMQLTFIPYLSHTGAWRCLIEGVRIARSHRGQGLGGRMIRWAIERARQRDCRLVQLTSDKQRPDALRFYGALGFVASHEGFKLKLQAAVDGGDRIDNDD